MIVDGEQMLWESKVFGKLSRYAPSYPPTVYFVIAAR